MKNYKFIFCIIVCTLLILFSNDAAVAARSGYDVFINNIFPSLLPFFVFTSMLGTNPLFLKNKYILFVLCVLSGAPCAARLLSDFELSENLKTRLCAALNTVSPMFTISVLATVSLKNTVLAIPIFISQAISVLIMLIPFFKSNISLSFENKALSFPSAIKDAMQGMLSLCGTIVVFFVLISVLNSLGLQDLIYFIGKNLLLLNEPQILNTLINGILEVTSGCVSLSTLNIPVRLAASFGAFFVTIGGICILIQSKSFFRLKSGQYIFFKLIQGIISAVIAYFITPLFLNGSVSVFTPVSSDKLAENATSMGAVIAVSMLVILFIFILGVAVKNITNPRKR